MKNRTILITGFEPFLGESINPSQILLQNLQTRQDLHTLLLPVSYQRSWEKLEQNLSLNNFDYLLMLGQAGGRSKIGLERVAINTIDAENKDEDGVQIMNKLISPDGPDAFMCSLPLREWLESCQLKNFPMEISNSAGVYVCNSIYYRALHYLQKNSKSTKALFVHFPYLPEQVFGKASDTPCLTLEVMKQALDRLLDLCRNL